MKKVLALSLIMTALCVPLTIDAKKYICSRDNMDDSVFTNVYKTKDECNKYCTGVGAVCEETGEDTPVNTVDVDF